MAQSKRGRNTSKNAPVDKTAKESVTTNAPVVEQSVVDAYAVEPAVVDPVEQSVVDAAVEPVVVDTAAVVESVVLDTVNDVQQYLSTPGDDIDTKLTTVAKSGPPTIKNLVTSILGYVEEFKVGTPNREPNYVLSKIFNLHNMIKAAVETVDHAEFKVKMDLISLLFKRYSALDAPLHPTKLLRYDYLWSWGNTSLKTHRVLTVVISSLADGVTRAEELKRINVKNSLASSGLSVTSDSIDRLIRYYSE